MNFKRFIACMLGCILTLSLTACEQKSKTNGDALTLWYEASTVKIKQDDEGEAVKSAKQKKTLVIDMARNESEGVQMMMYAKKDISSYTVSVSELKCGEEVISSDAITIYQMKYQTVEGNRTPGNQLFATGELPDPLLPFEKAVEYKETVIEKGDNQSIFFDVETAKETKAGIYKGTVTVKADGETYSMPMEVNVHDVVLADTAGLKTAFSYFDRDHFATAELDSSDEMTTTYFETLLDYNMSSWVPFEGEGGTEKYVELIRKYYNEPGFNSYRLYYQIASTAYNGIAVRYNAELLKQYIKALADASIEDRVDYLEKAYAYFYTVADEPATEEQFMTAKAAHDAFVMLLSDADEELRAQYAGKEEYTYYVDEISESVLTIPNVLPGAYDIDDAQYYGLNYLTFVPELSCLHTEADRQHYVDGREDMELWTYSCVGPVYPYPSGHTDDYCLGFRLTSWMCFDYDWDGYLMYAVANYLNLEYGDVKHDAWTSMDTGQPRPGDGRYFYPGEKYGLDYPCPSIRAIAYRDGVDDYALLEEVEAIYAENGLDAAAALQGIYDKLYSGVIPITDSDVFEAVRREVFSIIEDLQSDVGVLYKETNIELAEADLIFKTVNPEATVSVDGENVSPSDDGYYSFTIDLTEKTSFTYTVTYADESKEYTYALISGKLGTVNGFEEVTNIENVIFSSTEGYESEINENADFVKEGTKSLHISLNKDGVDTLPYFAILKDSELLGGKLTGVETFKFYTYNAGKKDITMNVTYYTTGEVTISDVKLVAGEWTLVEIPVPKDLDDVESITEFDFNFAQGESVELYMDGFATIVEEE